MEEKAERRRGREGRMRTTIRQQLSKKSNNRGKGLGRKRSLQTNPMECNPHNFRDEEVLAWGPAVVDRRQVLYGFVSTWLPTFACG